MPRWNCLGVAGCWYSGGFCSTLTSSLEFLEETEPCLRVGEFGFVGSCDERHCAACDGTVTVVIVFVVLVF